MAAAMRTGRWWTSPQQAWARRACFQLHVWTGLAIGLYVVVVSASGSAVVFRGELGRLLTPVPSVLPIGRREPREALIAAAARAFPRWRVTELDVPRDPSQPAEIVLRLRDERIDKLFDPYTGQVLGDRVPREPRSIEWLAGLHDNLLGGATGRTINGVGAIVFTLLCLTGAVLWWPGVAVWRRSLVARWQGSWRQVAWSTHSATGFWAFPLLLLWGVSGIYLAFPTPFNAAIDLLDELDPSGRAGTLGNTVLGWLAELHFGRFAGTGVKVVWVVLGLAPTVLFVTGAFMWWTRVVRARR